MTVTIENRSSLKEQVQLSRREIEVLALIGEGLRSKEAAHQLFVSKRTVDFHLANIYQKLNVNNRLQAYRVAERLGLLDIENHPFVS